MQQVGQGVHQLQSDTVVALGGNPDADPDVRLAPGVGQYVPGGADIAAVLLRHGKLGHTAVPCVVVVVQLRPVQQRQAHVKIVVDKINDGGVLAEARQPKGCLRQWPTLP